MAADGGGVARPGVAPTAQAGLLWRRGQRPAEGAGGQRSSQRRPPSIPSQSHRGVTVPTGAPPPLAQKSTATAGSGPSSASTTGRRLAAALTVVTYEDTWGWLVGEPICIVPRPSRRLQRRYNAPVPRQEDYQRLLEFRTGLRRFLRWSEQQAAAVGLTPMQHQLLLAVRGHPHRSGPTVGDVADYLHLRHHSAVGLIDRAEIAGLVRRVRDKDDQRVVRLRLTPVGARRIKELSELTLAELARFVPELRVLWDGLGDVDELPGVSLSHGLRRRGSSLAQDGRRGVQPLS